MPSVQIIARDDSTKSSGINPIYIAGFVVIGLIILAVAIWIAVRQYRKRAQKQREDTRGAAFLSVKGLVKEKDATEKSPATDLQGSTFSRSQMDSSVVLPERILTPPTHSEIVAHHRESGTFPRPFAPFSFALSAANPSDGSKDNRMSAASNSSLSLPAFRNSFMSISSGQSTNRFSVLSTASSNASSTTGHARKVRQIFTPVLPDELLPSLGERLTIVQSFDDGWCVVGRDALFPSMPKSLFKTSVPATAEVELGVVPAWCFLKPVKGLKAERPVRSTSLGITVQMNGPSYSSRDDVTSWSNF